MNKFRPGDNVVFNIALYPDTAWPAEVTQSVRVVESHDYVLTIANDPRAWKADAWLLAEGPW